MNTTSALRTLPPTGLLPDYTEPSYLRRLARMVAGFQKPRNTREYKAAVIELQRLSAPISALLLPALILALLMLLSPAPVVYDHIIETSLFTETPLPPLVDPPPPVDPAAPPDPTPFTFEIDTPAPVVETPPAPVTDQPIHDPLDTVLRNPSPVTLTFNTGIIRNEPARKNGLFEHGGGPQTEDAVLRALRWLKKNQLADGAWPSQKVAMTALAALTFLAHGEITDTAHSPEFGPTLLKALEFLLASQKPDGRFRGADGNDYAHPIATYALCEAYAMTFNPNLKTAAEKALAPIIRGQHPTGGWTYRLDPAPAPDTAAYRDDTSYMGWCVQALKAAHLAKLNVEGLDKAMKLAVRGFKRNAAPNGGFGYTGPGTGGLTSVGTLCLQLLGAANDPEVRKSLDLMDAWRPSFDAKGPIGASLQYYYYYATQCRFHAGGKRWESWNRDMKTLYVAAQRIEKNAVKDPDGRDCDIGWWANADNHTDRPVMDTCLAALQLMVYYRYLPTTSTAAIKTDPHLNALRDIDPDEIPLNLPQHL